MLHCTSPQREAQKRLPVFELSPGTTNRLGILVFLSRIDFFKGDCCFLIKMLKWLIVKLIQSDFFKV